MISCPGDPGSILNTSGESKKTIQDHGTSTSRFSLKSRDVDEIAAAGLHLRSDWEALVGRCGIYVEHHHSSDGDLLSWRRFGRLKHGDKGPGPTD